MEHVPSRNGENYEEETGMTKEDKNARKDHPLVRKTTAVFGATLHSRKDRQKDLSLIRRSHNISRHSLVEDRENAVTG